MFSGTKCEGATNARPTVAVRSSGTSLRIVVTTWKSPASLTPRTLIQVTSQMAPIAAARPAKGCSRRTGRK